ncbi:MAG: hypothetical protein OTJ44_07070 [Planctomycetota bacterium]|nr:hypothetical protein [Planctomycetota bacterium]
MFRTLLLLLAGSTLMAQPLFAQDCCADKTAAEKTACVDCSAEASSASDLAKGLYSLKGKMWACDVSLDAASESIDEQGTIKGKMQIAFADAKHFSISANVDLDNEEMGDGTMEISVVADGKEIFLQQEGMGQPAQVLKVQMTLFEKILSDESGMMADMGEASAALAFLGLGPGGEMFNPSAIDSLFATAGAMIVEAEEGLIRLVVKNTEMEEEGEEVPEVTVDFDAKTFFPKAITAAQESGGMLKVSFANVVFHEKLEGFGAKAFSFTAPEGMFVMDLTPMIEMQLQAAGGGMGDEEELEF